MLNDAMSASPPNLTLECLSQVFGETIVRNFTLCNFRNAINKLGHENGYNPALDHASEAHKRKQKRFWSRGKTTLFTRCGVGAEIISVLIKSDRLHKKVPRVGQTVRLEGRRGLFVVMKSDTIGRVADVMNRSGEHHLEENVPYELIQTVNEGLSEALNMFLDTTFENQDSRNHAG